eukprot:754957-Hanusia_phi.AAC.2
MLALLIHVFAERKEETSADSPASSTNQSAAQNVSVEASPGPTGQKVEEKTFLVGSKEWFESRKGKKQETSNADMRAGIRETPKNVSTKDTTHKTQDKSVVEVLKREPEAPKATVKVPSHENKASDLLEKERASANKPSNAPKIISYNQMRESVMGQVAALHTSRQADEIKKTIIRREVQSTPGGDRMQESADAKGEQAEEEEGQGGEGEEARGGELQEERKLFRGELSGNVLSSEESLLVGSSPTPGQCQMAVFYEETMRLCLFHCLDHVIAPSCKDHCWEFSCFSLNVPSLKADLPHLNTCVVLHEIGLRGYHSNLRRSGCVMICTEGPKEDCASEFWRAARQMRRREDFGTSNWVHDADEDGKEGEGDDGDDEDYDGDDGGGGGGSVDDGDGDDDVDDDGDDDGDVDDVDDVDDDVDVDDGDDDKN